MVTVVQYGYYSKTIVHLHNCFLAFKWWCFGGFRNGKRTNAAKKKKKTSVTSLQTFMFCICWKIRNKCLLIFSLHVVNNIQITNGRVHRVAMTTVTCIDAWLTIEYFLPYNPLSSADSYNHHKCADPTMSQIRTCYDSWRMSSKIVICVITSKLKVPSLWFCFE